MKIGSVNPIIGQYNKAQCESVAIRNKIEMGTDRLELSPEAKVFMDAFAAARKGMQTESPEKAVRVEEIMEQMRGGSYHVGLQDICDKLFM